MDDYKQLYSAIIQLLKRRNLQMAIRRVNEIDFLRFFAAVMVMLHHYSFRGYAADGMSTMPYPLLAPVAKYGYLGVQLFFLISGFVILMTASTGSLKKFIVSRFARLYPAFWVCCTVTFVTITTIGGKYYSASIGQYFINMTMLSGFIGVPSIDGAYWSIFTELKFYALIALLLIFRKINQAQLFLVLWLIATIALNVLKIGKLGSLLSIILIVDDSPYFIAGAMSFLVWSRGISLTRISVIFIAWLLAISYSLDDIPSRETHYNTEFNSYVVIGMISTFFAIMLLVSIRRTGFLGKRQWVTIGALTYPLYLLHQRIGFMIFNLAYPAINPHILLWGTVFLMLAAAYLVNVLIEQKYSVRLKNLLTHLIELIEQIYSNYRRNLLTYLKRKRDKQ
ncbi:MULTISPECIES: acyltransferase family protein [unclassified Microcoleus]|uniref:acyltransferase family protein n=2 Tax=unclassified Microcoleus TaxID=2642155 RepID=UPI002FCEAF68